MVINVSNVCVQGMPWDWCAGSDAGLMKADLVLYLTLQVSLTLLFLCLIYAPKDVFYFFQTHGNLFWILLNQTKRGLYIQFSICFGTKSIGKRIITIEILFDLTWFRKKALPRERHADSYLPLEQRTKFLVIRKETQCSETCIKNEDLKKISFNNSFVLRFWVLVIFANLIQKH